MTPWRQANLDPSSIMRSADRGYWAEIRRLSRAEGLSVKAIVRRTGISRNAVRRALASQGPPKYSRPARGSVFDEVEPKVCVLLRTDPRMPATVIAERVGWTHSVRLLRMRVQELRPLFLPADPASRTTYDPGELAHVRQRAADHGHEVARRLGSSCRLTLPGLLRR